MSDTVKMMIDSMAYGGRGVARSGGKVCFVSGALPGEEALVKINRQTPKYSEGTALDILKRSPERTLPLCPHFGVCGGCQLQHISYEKELYHKDSQVRELFKRIAGIELEEGYQGIAGSPSEYAYRTSVTLHKGKKGYGYFRESSHDVVEVRMCPVAVPAIGDNVQALTRGEDKDEITLKADHNGKVWSSCRPGERFFIDRYRGKDIYFSPKAFSQCNRYISEQISRTVEEWVSPRASGAAFFDIYCGSGFFSFTVGAPFASRIGVDESRVSIDCAKNTVKTAGEKNIKFYRQDADEGVFDIFEREKKKNNIFLLDPPRKGVGKVFLEKIRESSGVDLVYYISCDPACMARDVKTMTQGGKWRLGRIKPFDMFPRTGHIEVLGELVRRS